MLQSIFCKWQTPSSDESHHIYFSNNLLFFSSCWVRKGVHQGQVKLKAKEERRAGTQWEKHFP